MADFDNDYITDEALMEAARLAEEEAYLLQAAESVEAQIQQTGGGSGDDDDDDGNTDIIYDGVSITPIRHTASRKFGINMLHYRVETTSFDGKTRFDRYINRFFQTIINTVRTATIRPNESVDCERRVGDSDLIRLTIEHQGLVTPINLPLVAANQLSADTITAAISSTMQSREQFFIDSTLKVTVTIVPQFTGGRRTQHVAFSSIEDKIRAKQCVVRIENQDNLCMIHAIVVSKAKTDKSPHYTMLTNQRRYADERRRLAIQLLSECGLVSVNRSYGLPELTIIQEQLADYRIIVVDAVSNSIIFDGYRQLQQQRDGGAEACVDNLNVEKIIGLLHHKQHYHALINVKAWFEGKQFCYGCLKPYCKPGQHRCKTICSRCLGMAHESVPPGVQQYKKCDDCLRLFYTAECFANHKAMVHSGKSVCNTMYVCKLCDAYYNGFRSSDYGRKHECGKRICHNCGEMVSVHEHRCYMLTHAEKLAKQQKSTQAVDILQPPNKRQRKQPHMFIFWDTEARQENNGMHEANLFVAHLACEQCIDNYDKTNTTQFKRNGCEHKHETHFACTSVAAFGKFIMAQRNATCIAHNFKGYDSQFIMDYCRSNALQPDLIMTGAKCTYMYLKQNDVRFIDSCNFLPMALAKFPETFAFNEMRKGHFPHFFNTLANADYVGPLPPKDMYGYKTMRRDQRIEFDKWYADEQTKGAVFDMRRDIRAYCENDVAVLDRGCTQFREMLLSIANTDPFREAITIASTAQLIFRKMFLKSKQIGIVPPNGYRPLVNQSSKALVWLSWLANTRKITIRDCRHPLGEYRIGKYTVDGYDEKNKTVFEFLGSFWHGDLAVFNPNTFNPCVMAPMNLLHERTLARQRDIERLGYRYEAIWESTWDALVKFNVNVREFAESVELTLPLMPRDAFFGGRTNASQLYYKQPEDGSSKVHYVDFCSLYPSINKYGTYPLGHPTIITDIAQDATNIDGYFGLCKCTVIPPRDLYHPVLPYRHPDGKLMFPLCIKCANAYAQHQCTHTDEQRKWLGTWTTVELQHAVSRGYKITRVHEVWHFESTTMYDKQTGQGGLFAEYVNLFIKIKQEASGLPPGVQSDAEIEAYIADFYAREGVRLDRAKIEFNPGLRYVAKLFLNSLWGKFGQRSNLPVTEIVSSVNDLHMLIKRKDIEVMDLVEFRGEKVEDDVCQVQYRRKTDFIEESATTNIFIAAFTTAQARLKLLRSMEELDRRVLYYDTDSIIYISRNGDEEPKTGCFLGELTHELKPGEYIVEFFSGGPKNYGYRTSSGKIVQKHKGITLNAHVLDTLSYEAARDIVLHSAYGAQRELHVQLRQIRRLKHSRGLQTVDMRKRYGFDYDKRVIVANYDTLPYGHKDIPESRI